jgi:DNA end-binding protein Ku
MKAYALLRDALKKRDAAAIATFVLRTREHLVAVMPGDGPLMLEVLRFGHQLKDVEDVPLPAPSDTTAPNERELAMADQLIGGMMSDWDPRKYKDRYYRDVMKVIEEKASTGATKEHHARTTGTVARDDVVDLLALLEKSVARSGRAANETRPGPKKARAARTSGARKAAKKRRAA